MKKLHYFILLIFLMFIGVAQAQILFQDDEFENFDYNIKQIEEFILRFNLKELIIQPQQSKQYEFDNRVLLFDKSYYLDHQEELTDFLNSICKQQTTLSFYDSTWYAIAECNVTFLGKKDKITLILRPEQVTEDIYKWSIVDAQGNILELTPKTQSDKLRLLPTDNEVNFIALQSITTTNAQNILLYNLQNHINDQLSVFNSLVYYKLLKVDNVQSLSYCFTQVRGYEFYVKNFVRDEKNAGWLIYNVQKATSPPPSNNSTIDNSFAIVTQRIIKFYKMLSNFAKNPINNITLANNINSMFDKAPNGYCFFDSQHIYDDLDVYLHNHPSSYAYVPISDYLNTIENVFKEGIIVSYYPSDYKIVQTYEDTIKISYELTIQTNTNSTFIYDVIATMHEDRLVSIVTIDD